MIHFVHYAKCLLSYPLFFYCFNHYYAIYTVLNVDCKSCSYLYYFILLLELLIFIIFMLSTKYQKFSYNSKYLLNIIILIYFAFKMNAIESNEYMTAINPIAKTPFKSPYKIVLSSFFSVASYQIIVLGTEVYYRKINLVNTVVVPQYFTSFWSKKLSREIH